MRPSLSSSFFFSSNSANPEDILDMRNYHIFLLLCVIIASTASASSYKDEKYYDQAIAREIANWLVQAPPNRDASLYTVTATKRNSEIINSILGLPKNLNDVGKKSGKKTGED